MDGNNKTMSPSQNDFASLVAHQLKSPVSSSRWFVDLLISGKAGELNAEQRYLLDNLSDILKHINEVVEVLLRLGRIESGRIKIEPRSANPGEVIIKVVESLKAAAEKKGVELKVYLSELRPETIPLDTGFLWQAAEILISNAIKYSANGSKVEIHVEYWEKEIRFAIKDSGIGIPPSEHGHIFQKFYRAQNAQKLAPEGSGLGLSLAKSIISAWGGDLWFESQEGEGSTFYFTLPKAGMQPRSGPVSLMA